MTEPATNSSSGVYQSPRADNQAAGSQQDPNIPPAYARALDQADADNEMPRSFQQRTFQHSQAQNLDRERERKRSNSTDSKTTLVRRNSLRNPSSPQPFPNTQFRRQSAFKDRRSPSSSLKPSSANSDDAMHTPRSTTSTSSDPVPTDKNPTTGASVGGMKSVGIKVFEDTPVTSEYPIQAIGTMVGQNDPNVYSYQNQVEWGGKLYLLTLNIPYPGIGELLNPTQPMNQDQLVHRDSTIKMLNEKIAAFTDEFLKTLTAKGAIQPGANFAVVFDKRGYTAFIPDKTGYPTRNGSIEDWENTGYAKDCQSYRNQQTAALSQIINSGRNMSAVLELYKATYSSSASTSKTIGSSLTIEHGNNTCWAASATQYLYDVPMIKERVPQAITAKQASLKKLEEELKSQKKDAVQKSRENIAQHKKDLALLTAFEQHLVAAEKKYLTQDQINNFASALYNYNNDTFPLKMQNDANDVTSLILGLIRNRNENQIKSIQIAAKDDISTPQAIEQSILNEYKERGVSKFDAATCQLIDITVKRDHKAGDKGVDNLTKKPLERLQPMITYTLPTTNEQVTFRLTKVLIRRGSNPNDGHWFALSRNGNEYCNCNDLSPGNSLFTDEQAFLEAAKDAERLLYVKEPQKASAPNPQASSSSSAQPSVTATSLQPNQKPAQSQIHTQQKPAVGKPQSPGPTARKQESLPSEESGSESDSEED